MQETLTLCPDCGEEIHIGDFPFCPHEPTRSSRAQRFDPIVVHVSTDGSYRFPANMDAPVPEGYRKVEIRTLQEADRVTREVNLREEAQLRDVQRQSDASREATRARNREFIDRIAAGAAWRDRNGNVHHGLSSEAQRFVEGAREYMAQKNRERENSRPRSANFHMDVFSMDSSNREAYRDERTGWRGRKG